MSDQNLGWWAGTTAEYMNIDGPFDTRDEAITAGRADERGAAFWIMEASLTDWSPPSAHSVIEMIAENSDDLFYEDGFTGFDGGEDVEKAAEADLQLVLNAWFERHRDFFPTPTVFSSFSAPEEIDAVDIVPAVGADA